MGGSPLQNDFAVLENSNLFLKRYPSRGYNLPNVNTTKRLDLGNVGYQITNVP